MGCGGDAKAARHIQNGKKKPAHVLWKKLPSENGSPAGPM